jgi:hypothetical protein
MEEQFSGILHTMKDGWIDQLFAAFTDEDKFVDWAEDFLEKNPSIDLYYTLLPLNPEPGKMESRRFEIRNPDRKSLFRQAIEELNSLTGG